MQTTAAGQAVTLEGLPAVAAFTLYLALGIGYHSLRKWRHGRTLGNHRVDIRVSLDDGSPPSFRASLVRNVLRLVDFFPTASLVGIVALAVSDCGQRIGDRVADTVVVRP